MAEPNVAVTPAALTFRFVLNKQLLATININNAEDKRLAFKIKTTAPKKYVVRPSSGVVDPKSSISIQVIMQAQKEYPADFQNCKDKFMVQTTALGEDEAITADTFNKDTRSALREHRLKVVMEGPAAPPSPVPEANEGEEPSAVVMPGDVGASTDTRLRSTLNDLSQVSAENNTLKQQLAKVARENGDLRKRLDGHELQGARPTATGTRSGAAPSSVTAARFQLSIIHIMLAAILAFLAGHYIR